MEINVKNIESKISKTLMTPKFLESIFTHYLPDNTSAEDVIKKRNYSEFIKQAEAAFEAFSQSLSMGKKRSNLHFYESRTFQILIDKSVKNLQMRWQSKINNGLRKFFFNLTSFESENQLCQELLKTRIYWLGFYSRFFTFEVDFLTEIEVTQRPSRIWILFNEECLVSSYELDLKTETFYKNILAVLNSHCKLCKKELETLDLIPRKYSLKDFVLGFSFWKIGTPKEQPQV